MREAYQSQIDIEQNHIMKIFTLITAIFLPLTLMVGWYGMNFKHMYELNSPYSYPIFILISILVCISLVIYFKKNIGFSQIILSKKMSTELHRLTSLSLYLKGSFSIGGDEGN